MRQQSDTANLKRYKAAPLETSHLARVMKTHELMGNYVEICNLVIDRYRDQFPFNQMIPLGNHLLGGMHFGVEIYKDEPERTYDYYTVAFEDGKIEIIEHGKESPTIAWKMSRDYLEQVVENPNEYIENPLKLDWDWLKSRMGI